jgi:uncharacterized protein YegP (UPF0339 family)
MKDLRKNITGRNIFFFAWLSTYTFEIFIAQNIQQVWLFVAINLGMISMFAYTEYYKKVQECKNGIVQQKD